MKHKNTVNFIALMLILVLMGACNEDLYNELPQPIASFVSEYYPFSEVGSYSSDSNGYVVKMKNGATIAFDSSMSWYDFNGNGQTIPPTFLYNCLPDALYDFILEMEDTDNVYRAVRSGDSYRIYFSDTWVSYSDYTGEITYPTAAS